MPINSVSLISSLKSVCADPSYSDLVNSFKNKTITNTVAVLGGPNRKSRISNRDFGILLGKMQDGNVDSVLAILDQGKHLNIFNKVVLDVANINYALQVNSFIGGALKYREILNNGGPGFYIMDHLEADDPYSHEYISSLHRMSVVFNRYPAQSVAPNQLVNLSECYSPEVKSTVENFLLTKTSNQVLTDWSDFEKPASMRGRI